MQKAVLIIPQCYFLTGLILILIACARTRGFSFPWTNATLSAVTAAQKLHIIGNVIQWYLYLSASFHDTVSLECMLECMVDEFS